MNRVRIFISSPGDVADERRRALTVVESLQEEFSDTLSLETLLQEQESGVATSGAQPEANSPADFDIFATIIGDHLEQPPGPQFTRNDGSPYASTTELQFEVAIDSARSRGKPELLVYRKPLPADRQATAQSAAVSACF